MVRRTLLLVALLLAVGTLTGCEPTGHPRCDELLRDVQVEIEAHGWALRCDPEPGDHRHLGWADRRTSTVWLWVDRMPDDRWLRKVAWHELGHIEAWTRGLTFPSIGAEEVWADSYSYCREPFMAPVSYRGPMLSCPL